jgi:hypothetical protein
METYKKDLFFQSHQIPIECRQPTENDLALLREYISINLGEGTKTNQIFNIARMKFKNSRIVDGLESNTGFAGALSSLGLLSQSEVIIIWDYPNDVDFFDLKYVTNNWDEMWFGDSDDAVLLFFKQCNRMILVTHYNEIYY